MDAVRFGLTAFAAILTIVNPVSAAFLLLALTPGESAARRREQARGAVVVMTAIAVAAYFVGSYLLQFFSITRPALVLAAGVLVCRSGWQALTLADRLTPAQREEGMAKVDISFTPLGMPMLAGPGTISVCVGLSQDAIGIADTAASMAAIAAVAAVSLAILLASPSVAHRLGRTGEAVVSKLMGLITLCIGIQFLINGVTAVAGSLRG